MSAPLPAAPADASLEELLALAGRKYALEFERVSAGGVDLEILQIANMRDILDAAIANGALEDALHSLPLWAKIWPASLILAHVLGTLPKQGRSLLEIGAGCGLAGLAGAAFGFQRVVISDINEDALLFARINILKNNLAERAEARRIDIREEALAERFSIVAASEMLYLDELYRPLVKFLDRHLERSAAPPQPEALLAADHRRKVKGFLKRADAIFDISTATVGAREKKSDADAGERPERHLLHIYRLRRKNG